MRADRLLQIVGLLRQHGRLSAAELARRLEVTPRTVLRDINVLLFCWLPGLGMGDLIDVDFDALEGDGVIRLSNADYLSRPLRLGSSVIAPLSQCFDLAALA